MSIPALCYSDDRIIEAAFDAEPWFAQATPDQLKALAQCGWGGDYAADEVAIFMADHDQEVTKVFTYIELVGHKKNSPGFECRVEPGPAMEWLLQQRPDVAAELPDVLIDELEKELSSLSSSVNSNPMQASLLESLRESPACVLSVRRATRTKAFIAWLRNQLWPTLLRLICYLQGCNDNGSACVRCAAFIYDPHFLAPPQWLRRASDRIRNYGLCVSIAASPAVEPSGSQDNDAAPKTATKRGFPPDNGLSGPASELAYCKSPHTSKAFFVLAGRVLWQKVCPSSIGR